LHGERLAPKQLLGEAFTRIRRLQSILACDCSRRGAVDAANVTSCGTNQQASARDLSAPIFLHESTSLFITGAMADWAARSPARFSPSRRTTSSGSR